MERSERETARSRREDILHAAAALFAVKSFDGVSTRDISRAVGVNIATLYHYFPDKQSIYDEVMARAHASIASLLANAASGSEPAPLRLRRFISALVQTYSRESPEARLIDRQQLELSATSAQLMTARESIWPTHLAVQKMIGDLYGGTLDDTAIEQETRFLISMVYGATKLQPVHRTVGTGDPYTSQTLEDQLFEYYSNGVAARRASAEKARSA